uniref:Uncharacterized protein n=1 Tax=viral metagenome TaxID=1070528 RepID=A0A6M3JCL1_9ZZZZ
MSDRWGPSEDCKQCAQPQSVIDMFHCYECDKDMCKDCIKEHVCERFSEEFLIALTEPIVEAFGKINYYFSGEIHKEDYWIFEFQPLNENSPIIELKIKL